MIRTRNVTLAVVMGVVVFALGNRRGRRRRHDVAREARAARRRSRRRASGTGTARLTINTKTGRVCYRIRVKHVGTMVMGHIHKGGKTEAGPVFVGLFASPTKKPTGCVKAKKSEVRDIVEHPGRYYVNVHTAKYPAGAARGQLH